MLDNRSSPPFSMHTFAIPSPVGNLASDENHEAKQGHYPFDIEVVAECRYGLINPLGHYRTFLVRHQNILSEK